MSSKSNTTLLTITALLMAIAIIIPIVMPVKVVIGPASFTLASHVPIFIAMFFSPSIAGIVALGATLGFFLAGFPIIVVLRALSQVIFAVVGAKIIESRNLMDTIDDSKVKSQLFSFSIALIHALGETLVVTVFFYGGLGLDNSQGFFYTVFLLVGVGTLVHSMVDFLLAQYIWKAQKSRLMDLKLRIV